MTTQEPAAVTPPAPAAPSWGEMKDLGEGKFETKLITGEVFSGTAQEVISRLAEAKVNTKKWADEQVAAAREPAPAPAPAPEPLAAWQLDPAEFATALFDRPADGIVMGLAAAMNMTPKDVQDFLPRIAKAVGMMEQQSAQAEYQSVTAQFLGQHPDFPATKEATDSLFRVLEDMGVPPEAKITPKMLSAAHTVAVNQKLYSPLEGATAATTTSASSAPKPPPTPPSSSGQQHNFVPRQPSLNMTNEELLEIMKNAKG